MFQDPVMLSQQQQKSYIFVSLFCDKIAFIPICIQIHI